VRPTWSAHLTLLAFIMLITFSKGYYYEEPHHGIFVQLPATAFSLLGPNIYINAAQSEPTVTELWLDDRLPPGAEISSSSSRPDRLWCPPYATGTAAIPPGIERPGREADHSHTTGAEVKSEVRPSFPHTTSWHSVK
jgi:hypothetical protein